MEIHFFGSGFPLPSPILPKPPHTSLLVSGPLILVILLVAIPLSSFFSAVVFPAVFFFLFAWFSSLLRLSRRVFLGFFLRLVLQVLPGSFFLSPRSLSPFPRPFGFLAGRQSLVVSALVPQAANPFFFFSYPAFLSCFLTSLSIF